MDTQITKYGLIGYPLGHSFSKKYFSEKFEREGLINCEYHLFEIEDLTSLQDILKTKHLKGLNVTIPYKEQVIPYLKRLDESAHSVGAVNVIRIFEDGAVGYNSDYYGFKQSLETWLANACSEKGTEKLQALVLGTGGASKAVIAALEAMDIPYFSVSRTPTEGDRQISYDTLKQERDTLGVHRLIINTTPLGMAPHYDTAPDIPYDALGEKHLLYDLVYNPLDTTFLQRGRQQGALTKNGLEMLHLQAEKSWEVWNRPVDSNY